MLDTYPLTRNQLFNILKEMINSSGYTTEYNSAKNKIYLFDINKEQFAVIHLPWIFPALKDIIELFDFIHNYNSDKLSSIIILIQAGYAALTQCSAKAIEDYKLVRKYMVRKKQGKAQITYLNQKGKSRAGSRIRLNQTVQFFLDINEQVNFWIKEQDQHRIMISCPPTLWGLMYHSRIRPLFSKKDERLFKIPVSIKRPDKQELIRIHKLAGRTSIDILKSDPGFQILLSQIF